VLTSQRRSRRVIEVGGGDVGRLEVAEDRRSHLSDRYVSWWKIIESVYVLTFSTFKLPFKYFFKTTDVFPYWRVGSI
jgi:hypothetical protein